MFVSYQAESAGNHNFVPLGISQQAGDLQAGGNMEGKEVRFGIADLSLFETTTTDTSSGAVNSAHDSYTPIGGLVPIVNMQLGEIIFGGVGCGLYGMLLFAILSVFIAGLMVGRTPEYLGKKIRSARSKNGDAGDFFRAALRTRVYRDRVRHTGGTGGNSK